MLYNRNNEIYIPILLLYMFNFIMFLSFNNLKILNLKTILHIGKNMVGLIGFIGICKINLKLIKENSFIIYMFNIFLLIFVHFLGMIGLGARRWINLGLFQLQPSELMKITLPLYLSYFLSKNTNINLKLCIKYAVLCIIPIGLVIIEPDLATGMILTIISLSLIFVSGISKKYILSSVLTFIMMLPIIWNKMYDYQKQRILTFIYGHQNKKSGYQIAQSRITVGSGGLLGKGFLKGSQFHNSFLPKSDTDFVFSCICEEWGLLGGVFLITIYLYLTLLAIKTSLWKESLYEKYLSLAIAIYLFCSFFFNIAMSIGAIPVMGVPLPLISRGGSATLTFLISLGILLNLRR